MRPYFKYRGLLFFTTGAFSRKPDRLAHMLSVLDGEVRQLREEYLNHRDSETADLSLMRRWVALASLQLRQLGIVACWFWGCILCLLLSVVLPVTCSALEIRRVQTCSGLVLRLRGDIKEGDFSQLKSHFRGKEAIVGFDLSSDGGVLEEGLRIADLTRHNKLTVYVAGECNSVCADVFFAAAKRYFEADSKIGVHAVSNYRDLEDVGSKLLTIKLARLWAEQGVPNSAIGKMVTTRPETITYLDRADLSGLDASAGNPFAYKAEKPSKAGQARQQSCATQLHASSGVRRELLPVR